MPKRSHTFPDSQEKQAAIQAIKEITAPKPPVQKPVAPVQPVQPVAPAETLDEGTITRKSATIADELSQNKDFKVCVGILWRLSFPSTEVDAYTIVNPKELELVFNARLSKPCGSNLA